MTERMKTNLPGILLCLLIAIPAWLLGKVLPVVGGAVIAILMGMGFAAFRKKDGKTAPGIQFTTKYILQTAVVLLGFGLNLNVILQTGKQSLPIIAGTIAVALLAAFFLYRRMGISSRMATLIGVGSSICGGSAIAAAAPVIGADDDEIAQAVSVIFFFNVLAALIFPFLGRAAGFSTAGGEAFGIFVGTAVNDTSSVTAAASAWDSMWGLGSQTLDKAVTVKLTRTLAILPITLALALSHARRAPGEAESSSDGGGRESGKAAGRFRLRRSFPVFILYFLLASLAATLAAGWGFDGFFLAPLKECSRFCIVMAMAGIGLNSNLVSLVKAGGRPLLLGGICWAAITGSTLLLQHLLGIW